MKDPQEQRFCVKFCFKLGKTFMETSQMLQQAYGEDCLSRTQCHELYQRFKSGRTSSTALVYIYIHIYIYVCIQLLYNRALYTYINVRTCMHPQHKSRHLLCSWSGYGPGEIWFLFMWTYSSRKFQVPRSAVWKPLLRSRVVCVAEPLN